MSFANSGRFRMALILMSAVTLAACAAPAEDARVIDYDDAKSELVTLLEETAEAIGEEWTIGRFEGEGWCNYAEAVDGKNFAAWRTALPDDNSETVAEQVRDLWESKGFEVTTRVIPDPDVHEVIARGSGGFHASFGSSAQTMILTGESACIRDAG